MMAVGVSGRFVFLNGTGWERYWVDGEVLPLAEAA